MACFLNNNLKIINKEVACFLIPKLRIHLLEEVAYFPTPNKEVGYFLTHKLNSNQLPVDYSLAPNPHNNSKLVVFFQIQPPKTKIRPEGYSTVPNLNSQLEVCSVILNNHYKIKGEAYFQIPNLLLKEGDFSPIQTNRLQLVAYSLLLSQ